MTIDDLVQRRLKRLDQFSEKRGLGFPGPNANGFCPEAWFLGPKAENLDLLKKLINAALDRHARHRQDFHPLDAPVITRTEPGYAEAVAAFERESAELFKILSWSVPVSSMRHQGHMLWDQVMPAVVGYFAGMLYNQNNVAAESSAVTTLLEIELAKDLCAMLGFAKRGETEPWGHITCGGSVANIEALWAERNAKYLPLAVREALKGPLRRAAKIEVLVRDKKRPLARLNDWEILNLRTDEALNLSRRLEEFKYKPEQVQKAIAPFALPKLGWLEFSRAFPGATKRAPVILCPGTRHYSWPKGATLLGLGDRAVHSIPIDDEARLDVKALRRKLERCLRARTPVIAVVAVIGTTAESAVDPLARILEERERFRARGLDFAVHCDAAWGGYFAAMLRSADAPAVGGIAQPAAHIAAAADVPALPMSSYVREHYEALKGADSITVDPHKAGYVPYPAGALCYSNSAMRDMVSLAAPVVYRGEAEPTVGIYGIEGSKPGAAAASTWLAHRVVRTTRAGYGAILERCMWTALRLYCRLVTFDLRHPGLEVKLVPLIRLPVERDGGSAKEIEAERQRLLKIARLPNDEFADQPGIHELGPDLVINAFACNLAGNSSLRKMNDLNRKIFQLCSVTEPRDYTGDTSLELIITNSSMDPVDYGQRFVSAYCRRLGVRPAAGETLEFLICTSMDPWRTATPGGDFLDTLETAFADAVRRASEEVRRSP